MDNILEGLNDAQREAVKTLSGPLLFLAGAGSGKTKTLTHRIANLIQHGIQPPHILAVTFTNKAAHEMRERLWRLLSSSSSEVPYSFMPYMGTFHSICVKILRIEAEAANLPRNFVIYDTDDQVSLIKRIMKNLKITDFTHPIRRDKITIFDIKLQPLIDSSCSLESMDLISYRLGVLYRT